MEKIDDLFTLEAARSKNINDYDPGDFPFITSVEINNGIVGYVEPEEDDKLFDGNQIAISGLGFATVQLAPFLPKGNGGDSITVLTPKKDMSFTELISFVGLFNILHKWRFSYGRKCSISRLRGLKVPHPFPEISNILEGELESLKQASESISSRFS